MYWPYLAIVVVILLLIVCRCARKKEGFGPCSTNCDGGRMRSSGTSVINPFIYPYSGTSCINDLYILNKDNGLDIGFSTAPLTHLSTPDHVELVN